MSKDFFAHKAQTYENDKHRVSNVDNIANAIIHSVNLHPSMHLMDFGSGTGLLLERLAPYVNKITAVDVSTSMNEQLAQKQPSLECELEILQIDLTSERVEKQYDGIISSMTMHHVKDIEAMFGTFYTLLKKEGFIAISDLDTEDGSFHTEDTGVYHFGFDRDIFVQSAKKAGFFDVKVATASAVYKTHGTYPVFLLTAIK
jgi:cyclopropane fatty-acyl-phospholipid synthase-like methyltransferase